MTFIDWQPRSEQRCARHEVDSDLPPHGLLRRLAAARKLRDALAAYVAAARSTGGRRGGRKSSATNLGPSAREVRDWARSNGYKVPDRGRIQADVRSAFDAAN